MQLHVTKQASQLTYDDRLMRQVATEGVKFGRGSWLHKMTVAKNLGGKM